MGYEYTQAREVLVWLGKGLSTSHLLAWTNFIHEQGTSNFRIEHIPDSFIDTICRRSPNESFTNHKSELFEICRHDYWNRAWIAHEILLQLNVKVLIGFESISWVAFSGALSEHCLRKPEWEQYPAYGLAYTWYHRNRISGNRATVEFWDVLERRSNSACFDIRDKIYSLLALVSAANSQ